MMQDRYGNALSTSSARAQDAYVEGMNRFQASAPDVEAAFAEAAAADPGFTLAHVGVARARQARGNGKGAREAIAEAHGTAAAGGLTEREKGHLHALSLIHI